MFFSVFRASLSCAKVELTNSHYLESKGYQGPMHAKCEAHVQYLSLLVCLERFKKFPVVSGCWYYSECTFWFWAANFNQGAHLIKGDQIKPHKSFNKFLCLNLQFGGRKWVPVGKNHFLTFFSLWSKVQKLKENTEKKFSRPCEI